MLEPCSHSANHKQSLLPENNSFSNLLTTDHYCKMIVTLLWNGTEMPSRQLAGLVFQPHIIQYIYSKFKILETVFQHPSNAVKNILLLKMQTVMSVAVSTLFLVFWNMIDQTLLLMSYVSLLPRHVPSIYILFELTWFLLTRSKIWNTVNGDKWYFLAPWFT